MGLRPEITAPTSQIDRAVYDQLLLNRPNPILDKARATEAIAEARESLVAWLAKTRPHPDLGESN